jgi:hypothetical protein
MRTVFEIILTIVGVTGVAFAALHPNANQVERLVAIGVGIVAIIAAVCLYANDRRDRKRW